MTNVVQERIFRGAVAGFEKTRPIAFRVEQEVQPNADAEVRSLALMNSTGQPVEILEFKFSARPANLDAEGVVSGGVVGVQLSVMGKRMTNGPIPLWSFGPSFELGLEEFPFHSPTLPVGPVGCVHRFKLDEPLFLPPGVAIEATLRSFGGFDKAIICSVVASGRVVPNKPTPHKVKIPWVCAYASKSFGRTESGSDQSSESQLLNPFNVPVTVRRFVGRLAQLTNDSTIGIIYINDADNLFGPGGGVLGYYATESKIRMFDSVGSPIIRVATSFRNVFDAKNRSWETNHKLPPRQYYKVFYEKDTSVDPAFIFAPPTGTTRTQIQVSFVGWREETL